MVNASSKQKTRRAGNRRKHGFNFGELLFCEVRALYPSGKMTNCGKSGASGHKKTALRGRFSLGFVRLPWTSKKFIRHIDGGISSLLGVSAESIPQQKSKCKRAAPRVRPDPLQQLPPVVGKNFWGNRCDHMLPSKIQSRWAYRFFGKAAAPRVGPIGKSW